MCEPRRPEFSCRQPFLAHGYLGLRDGTWVERVYEVSVMDRSEINREAHRKAEQEQGFHFWCLSWSERAR